ncbi:MAG: NADH-quinone oxidoreductase subunit N [Rhizobiales bacterium TMED143]|nr:NADH-quinone oxidoreductase subunit NuoN [Rhodobiaceae bacterium]MBL6787634.1 NADH-quinone oxidoreductase subunit NuoN [PS1 clade bacterium]OUV92457.1 MAG: NADH-quinone oxidoreductase subunit N [Rhizobiales bacterium TMED143]HCQ81458.1 NADH-quinone oxidoreductase subunit NuoN [Rhodobiaceae bacterium]|tara:strand:- start:429 stop:1925 length:1497 start_codon:yes stop_codon:yes gene_type:complete
MLANVILLLPELVLFLGAMGLLMVGAFAASDATRTVEFGAISLLLIAAVASWLQGEAGAQLAFSGSFIVDQFSAYMKTLTYLATAVIIIMSRGFMQNENLARFEVPVLMVLAAVGMGMMISANDLISLYMGIELQSLALYVLAAIKRDSLRATEAGLKYFVLGALSSGMLLYGASLIYGFSGTTNFTGIAAAFTTENGVLPLAQVVGMVFLLAGLAFKISAVPFHMWTPDVYEGAPTPMTAFFAAAPKLAGMAVFLRVVISAFPDALVAWQQIIIFISIASMVLGAFAAIGQTNIKRLMAYSSIGHMGFALVGFAAGSEDGVAAVILYMTLYGIMTLGAFACILSMRRDSGMVEQIKSLSGLSQVRPFMALCLAILMFSLAGIPPLAGFFGKLFVFHAAIDAGLYGLCVLGVLSSVVGAYYYLRIVKIMYLDPPADEANDPMPRELSIIAGLFAGVCLVFFVYPSPLIDLATNAGQALTAVPSPEAVLTGVFGAPEVR